MTARQYMIAQRMALGETLPDMARKLKITPLLLGWLEDNDKIVTHPKIVKRIAKAYGLTEEQRVSLLPANHRPGPDYDPGRYAMPDDMLHSVTVIPGFVRVWK